MKTLNRNIVLIIGLLVIWQAVVWMFHTPSYILPGPSLVFHSFYLQDHVILKEAVPTIIETLLGLFFGSLMACIMAIAMIYCKPLKFWMLPILLLSQAIPTFAIAPLLVVWFGYGMASKIITAGLMLFFPVVSNFYDGLRNTPKDWLNLANTMQASRWQTLWRIRIPAALPSLASGLRIAATIAPIGAVIGEWVGASTGLGYLMLNSDARMDISLMFATLLMLTVFTLVLYFSVDRILKKVISWQ